MLVDSSIENLAVMCPYLEFVVLSLPFRENSQQMYNTIVELKGRTMFVGEHVLNASISLDAFKKLLPLINSCDQMGGAIVSFLERAGYSNDVVIYAAQVFGFNTAYHAPFQYRPSFFVEEQPVLAHPKTEPDPNLSSRKPRKLLPATSTIGYEGYDETRKRKRENEEKSAPNKISKLV
jgi:hypothetical protein